MSTSASPNAPEITTSATSVRTDNRRTGNNRHFRGNRATKAKGGYAEHTSGTTTDSNAIGGRKKLFKGDATEMNSNVFHCYEEQSNRRQYAKTLEALEAYVKKHLTNSDDLALLFAPEMKMPSIQLPPDPKENAGTTMKMIFAEEIKDYVRRMRALKVNIANVYSIISFRKFNQSRGERLCVVTEEHQIGDPAV